jgi:BCD family chlorophyll transporter-like MFS transporter
MASGSLGWFGIVRLGLVQTALGTIVVLTTSTMNRVMVVEFALPAVLPGLLVALHYAVQIMRPRLGYCSDVGGRRTPWIIGGMAVLGLSGITAALATALMASLPLWGIVLAAIAFLGIGLGVGATGTSLLVLLAETVDDRRRPAAATIVWVMMIAGFVITATVAGHFLDPFSPMRLVAVTAAAAVAAFALTLVAVSGIETRAGRTVAAAPDAAPEQTPFREAFRQVWAEPQARRFAIFVFVSMLAYSGQDLILEPFAGAVFGLTPGESTKLAGVQHAGVLLGMVLVALAGSAGGKDRAASMRGWTIAGCLISAIALGSLALAAVVAPAWPLRASVFALGAANGAFAVAAIASMMRLVSAGRKSREGVRMGLWGAAQAIAFGLGGVVGTAAVDLTRYLSDSVVTAYATVFSAEAALFLVAAVLAARVYRIAAEPAPVCAVIGGESLAVSLEKV